MSNYWNAATRALSPYTPGEQPKEDGLIKLNTNENPYPPPPQVLETIKDAVDGKLRLYPDPDGAGLCHALAAKHGVPGDHIFVGNGSDEVLAFAFRAFFEPGRPVLFPDVTYSFYSVYANLFGLDAVTIPLNEHLHIVPADYERPCSGIIFPNPNAPTGCLLPQAGLRQLLERHTEHVVIVDEAYIAFGGESAVPLIAEYPQLLVIHTLSKSHSLAGLRVGYAIGQPELIEGLRRVKNSFNSYTLDRLALAGAEAAVSDETAVRANIANIVKTREAAANWLRALGFTATDSMSNFLFVSHPGISAQLLYGKLRERSILVRHFNRPRIANYLRITVGTESEMAALAAALEAILREEGIHPAAGRP